MESTADAAEQGLRDGQQWKRCLDAALCSLRAIVFVNESVLVRVEQLSECMRERGAHVRTVGNVIYAMWVTYVMYVCHLMHAL